jgi:rRNA maturation endonuclease Nob1
MKIHDAIICELIKPDPSGKPTGEIIKIVGTSKIRYRLEHSFRFLDRVYETNKSAISKLFENPKKRTVIEEMTPDIVVVRLGLPKKEKNRKYIAIELETDYDFGASLRQIKKYQKEFYNQVTMIISKKYEKFAPLYKNERINVWLWDAERIWECGRCGNKTISKETNQHFCTSCKKNTEHKLVDVQNVIFEEFC